MATITSSGIGSGLDVNGIINQLMAIERQPLTKLATKEAGYQAKLSAFGTLKGAFASLQTAARALTANTLFSGMTATAADTSVLTSSANTSANAANYAIDVVKLAKGQTIASTPFASLTDDTISTGGGAGKLKIELGAVNAGVFTRDSAKAAVTIDIPQAASSLNEVRDAINNANAGVTARIVNVGVDSQGNDQYKLMVSANGTGAKTHIRMTAVDGDDNPVAAPVSPATNLTQFNYDPVSDTGGFAQTAGAQDALIKVNSLEITRSTNTINDAITGVTLVLAKEGTTSLAIAKNTAAVSSTLEAFVTAFNAANEQARQLTAYNTETLRAAVLTGDSGARALQTALRDMMGLTVTTQSANVRRLSDIGLSMQRDGSLRFDSAKLASALKDNPAAVEELVTRGTAATKGIASRITTTLDNILNERGGVLSSRTDGIDRSITELGKQRATLLRRLEQIEVRYRRQFSSLDIAMSNMQKTSQYLQQQFAALSKSSS